MNLAADVLLEVERRWAAADDRVEMDVVQLMLQIVGLIVEELVVVVLMVMLGNGGRLLVGTI